MSDTRFTLLGIGLIFAGFIILGTFGAPYFDATIQVEEFGDCFEYFDDRPPVPVKCETKLQDKMMFSGLVIGLVGAGVASLIKGVKGRWDQDVKPEDMLGPRHPSSDEPSNHTNSDD
ncbi:MAG: hypothetical protein ACT4NJ_02165 [Nitrosopumilaceae archaeon]